MIQRASERALRQGTTLEQVLALAQEIRRHSSVGMIVFTYFNPVLRLGLEAFAAGVRDSGMDGALITDLPVEEAGPYLQPDAATKLSHGISGRPHELRAAAEAHRCMLRADLSMRSPAPA